MVRTALFFSAFSAVSFFSSIALGEAAQAQERPYLPSMSCGAASALVTQRGAILAGTGPQTFERLVAHGGFCTIEQVTAPAWERTADNPQCFVGYRCRDRFTEGSETGR
jgi:hypothetical protein